MTSLAGQHKITRAILPLALVFGMGVACAQPAAQTVQQLRIVDRNDLAEMWVEKRQRQGSIPVYPPKMAQAGHVGCINVGFVIEADGRVGGMRVLRSSIDPLPLNGELKQLEASMAMWLSSKRYAPGTHNLERTPVFTREAVVVLAGEGRKLDWQMLRDRALQCDVGSLPDHLQGKKTTPAIVDNDLIVLSFSMGRTVTIP